MRFLEWARLTGVASNDPDVAKMCYLIQWDTDFVDASSAEEAKFYLAGFMSSNELLEVLLTAIDKAWGEYATDTHHGTG
jgi:hypothetical protein